MGVVRAIGLAIYAVATCGCLLTSSFDGLQGGHGDGVTPPSLPEVIATGQASPRSIVVVGSDLYWTNSDGQNGAVMHASTSGQNVAGVVSALNGPFGLAVDSTRAFWTENGSNQIASCALSGCAMESVLERTQRFPYGIAVDGSSVYWVTSDAEGGVLRAAKDGSGLTVLASKQAWSIDVAVDDTTVYWTNSGGSVAKVPKTGGAPTTLAQFGTPQAIALDAAFIYVTDYNGGGNIVRIAKSDGAMVTLATGQGSPNGVAVDGNSVYWTVGGEADANGAVRKCPLAGGPVASVAEGQAKPFGIAVDASAVYWANQGDGTILRRAK